jgi:Na+-transporting NADH:ubiquinone oxidoreductase subunit NqrD
MHVATIRKYAPQGVRLYVSGIVFQYVSTVVDTNLVPFIALQDYSL